MENSLAVALTALVGFFVVVLAYWQGHRATLNAMRDYIAALENYIKALEKAAVSTGHKSEAST